MHRDGSCNVLFYHCIVALVLSLIKYSCLALWNANIPFRQLINKPLGDITDRSNITFTSSWDFLYCFFPFFCLYCVYVMCVLWMLVCLFIIIHIIAWFVLNHPCNFSFIFSIYKTPFFLSHFIKASHPISELSISYSLFSFINISSLSSHLTPASRFQSDLGLHWWDL